MPREKIILNPKELVRSAANSVLGFEINIRMEDNCVNEHVFDQAQQQSTVDVLNPQRGLLLPVGEPWDTGMHKANLVQIRPRLRLVVVQANEFYQISPQKVLPELDIGMVVTELINLCLRRVVTVLTSLLGRKCRCSDVKGQQFVVDAVDEVGDEGSDDGLGGVKRVNVGLCEFDEVAEVLDACLEVIQSGGVDVLEDHCSKWILVCSEEIGRAHV